MYIPCTNKHTSRISSISIRKFCFVSLSNIKTNWQLTQVGVAIMRKNRRGSNFASSWLWHSINRKNILVYFLSSLIFFALPLFSSFSLQSILLSFLEFRTSLLAACSFHSNQHLSSYNNISYLSKPIRNYRQIMIVKNVYCSVNLYALNNTANSNSYIE